MKSLCEALPIAIKTFPPKTRKRASDNAKWTRWAFYSPIEYRGEKTGGAYCALGWLLHCAGASDSDILTHPNILLDELGLYFEDTSTVVLKNDHEGRSAGLSALIRLKNEKCGSEEPPF